MLFARAFCLILPMRVPLPHVAVPDGRREVRVGDDSTGPLAGAVDTRSAPITAANFLKYIDGGCLPALPAYPALPALAAL